MTRPEPAPTVDPVCGMTVARPTAAARRKHRGRRFFFCATACAETFDKDPEKYLSRKERSPSRSVSAGKPDPMSLPVFAAAPASAATAPPPRGVSLALTGMHCASCVTTIEKALGAVPGVSAASVNLGTGRADVRGAHLDPERLVAAVRASGYDARPAGDEAPDEEQARARRELADVWRRTLVAAALTAPVAVLSMADVMFPARHFALLALTLPVYLWAGAPFLSGAMRTLKHRAANMDTLIALGTTAAL
ncbi:MAG TPA: cation transporter, partial [Thermoanaerobaculia bacterium]